MEFAEKEMVDEAVKLNESLFKGRQIKVGPFLRALYMFYVSSCFCI